MTLKLRLRQKETWRLRGRLLVLSFAALALSSCITRVTVEHHKDKVIARSLCTKYTVVSVKDDRVTMIDTQGNNSDVLRSFVELVQGAAKRAGDAVQWQIRTGEGDGDETNIEVAK